MLTFEMFLEQYEYDQDFASYSEAIRLLEMENGKLLTEFELVKLTDAIKEKYWFFVELAQISKTRVQDLLVACKNKKIFEFFREIKFSLGMLYSKLKAGFQLYTDLQLKIADYVASTKVVKWTDNELKKLQDFLVKHPALKKVGGVVVGGLLLWMFLDDGGTSTGNANYDMDLSSALKAVKGDYDLPTLFGGPEGTRMLLLFATGKLTGLTFPWPMSTNVKLVLALVNGIYKLSK